MISERVVGVYAAMGGLTVSEQVDWYTWVARTGKIATFEIPLFAGRPLASELVDLFTELKASLVVTLVAQWGSTGQTQPAYGMGSTVEKSRVAAYLDACDVIRQCRELDDRGIRIRNLITHAGQRTGSPVAHAVALSRSLSDLSDLLESALPDTSLAVEPADTRPLDHPIPFPISKKTALDLSNMVDVVAEVNNLRGQSKPVGMMLNYGRLQIDGRNPLAATQQVLASGVPLSGVILSGAGASPEGFRDAHNSHLDPESGFTAEDAQKCGAVLSASEQSSFVGMKCSRASANGELSVAELLQAETDLLHELS